jgi:hypothetical protein
VGNATVAARKSKAAATQQHAESGPELKMQSQSSAPAAMRGRSAGSPGAIAATSLSSADLTQQRTREEKLQLNADVLHAKQHARVEVSLC